MSKKEKKWTVGDQVAVFIEGPYVYESDEIPRDRAYVHSHFSVKARMHQVPRGAADPGDTGISIQVKDGIPWDFVGVVLVELVHQEDTWRSVWKVVRDE